MAAVQVQPPAALLASSGGSPPSSAPIDLIYKHFHNSIRVELGLAECAVRSLVDSHEPDLRDHLLGLKERYRFLEQIYKYHSSVEDEVVYPALDSKVKNVTMAYSVEHQDEEFLFEQLSQLLTEALRRTSSERTATIRDFACKVEEVHTTLRKHLQKEEEQLFPLLLRHFSHAEQAELVAQFLYCIPLAAVERVLSWLTPSVPEQEQEQLLGHVSAVVPDQLLLQLILSWMRPAAPPAGLGGAQQPQAATVPLPAGSAAPAAHIPSPAKRATAAGAPSATPKPPTPPAGRPPLQDITHFHRSICSALTAFAAEARSLQAAGPDLAGPGALLSTLVERHRFLRSVCTFHSISEEEVMFPLLESLERSSGKQPAGGALLQVSLHCQHDHDQELSHFEELGRLLADVRAFARRGRREVGPMLEQLAERAERVSQAIAVHMEREEADVLPVLQAALDTDAQRRVLWCTLRAMPLRLLQRVMPWVTAALSPGEVAALLANMRLGAPDSDKVLVELLTRWAMASPGGASTGQHMQQQPTAAARPSTAPSIVAGPAQHGLAGAQQQQQPGSGQAAAQGGLMTSSLQGDDGDDDGRELEPATKRLRTAAGDPMAQSMSSGPSCAPTMEPCGVPLQQPARASSGAGSGGGSPCSEDGPGRPAGAGPNSHNPIDHIFQFHKALRQELRQLEENAVGLERLLLAAEQALQQQQEGDSNNGATGIAAARSSGSGNGSSGLPGPMQRSIHMVLQQADGRFNFLWGIYRAHSLAEDQIVFPALESREALHNVSHSYSLDHQQEEGLFHDVADVIEAIKKHGAALQLAPAAGKAATAAPATAGAGQTAPLPAGAPATLSAMCGLSSQLRRMCAAVRASLETHVRAEERELWPLFAEHFSVDEQRSLVGTIIGRTGAEVLQTLLPWVTSAFTEEEAGAMMDSWREATKNTMFDAWLDAIQSGGSLPAGGGATAAVGASTAAASGAAGVPQPGSAAAGAAAPGGFDQPLADLAQYLHSSREEGTLAWGSASSQGDGAGGGAQGHTAGPSDGQEVPGTVADSSTFRPGWEDIFRMNQKQLEAAIRRVSNDPALEPARKAYLIQNMMVSKYIVAQQLRMQVQVNQDQQAAEAEALLTAQPAGGQQGCQQAAAAQGAEGAAQTSTSTAAGGNQPLASSRSEEVVKSWHGPGVLGCKHYATNAALVAPCCGRAFACRLCHDEASDHKVDRYAISRMQCMLCGLQQPVASACCGCGATMAAYYCSICHLLDDAPGAHIYHCPFCNVCRKGKGLGQDFFHCMNCNACMSLALFNKHKCREKCMEGNCPVCFEYLFDSSAPIKELPCGHFMHSSCFAAYTRYNYTCPICCKSCGDMSVYFQMLDSLLAAERARLPPEFAGKAQQVLCHDCGRTSATPYHFVYHACSFCQSYNTRVL